VSAILDELLMYFIFYACSLPRPEAKSKQIINQSSSSAAALTAPGRTPTGVIFCFVPSSAGH
jgi:hypothetical protein